MATHRAAPRVRDARRTSSRTRPRAAPDGEALLARMRRRPWTRSNKRALPRGSEPHMGSGTTRAPRSCVNARPIVRSAGSNGRSTSKWWGSGRCTAGAAPPSTPCVCRPRAAWETVILRRYVLEDLNIEEPTSPNARRGSFGRWSRAGARRLGCLPSTLVTVWEELSGDDYHPWAETVMLVDIIDGATRRGEPEQLLHGFEDRLGQRLAALGK